MGRSIPEVNYSDEQTELDEHARTTASDIRWTYHSRYACAPIPDDETRILQPEEQPDHVFDYSYEAHAGLLKSRGGEDRFGSIGMCLVGANGMQVHLDRGIHGAERCSRSVTPTRRIDRRTTRPAQPTR